jgi:hypothetical protein
MDLVAPLIFLNLYILFLGVFYEVSVDLLLLDLEIGERKINKISYFL